MKKYLLTISATAICNVLFVSADAQKLVNNLASANFKNVPSVFSEDVSGERKEPESVLYKINFKAVSDFKNTYKNISGEIWETSENGSVVRFISSSVRTLNAYDKKGRWLHCIRYYDESKLPENVRARVKSNYYDYSITSAQEISLSRGNKIPVYLVNIAYNDDHKTIRVCDDEMEEIHL